MADLFIRPGRERQMAGVDPALLAIIHTAALNAPPAIGRVELFSGVSARSTGTKNHPSGRAVDIQLYDQNGNAYDRYVGNPFGVRAKDAAASYQAYEQFAQTARMVQQRDYPDLSDRFRWGGYFTGGVNPGDLMHFDLSGGLSPKTPPQTERWASGLGNGITLGAAAAGGTLPATPASLTAPAVGVAGHSIAAPSPDADLLARVMLAEARGEGQDGMLAVGQVAMNRIRDTSGRFPQTLSEVLTGGEFAKPATVDPDSAEYQTAVAMAGGIINGVAPNPVGDAVYFMNPRTATRSGAQKIRDSGPLLSTIGNHEFYGGGKFEHSGVSFQPPQPTVDDVSPIEYAAASLPDETFTPRLEGTATTGTTPGANAVGRIPFTPPGMTFAGASRPMTSAGPAPSLGVDLATTPTPGARPPLDLSNLLPTVTTGSTAGANATVNIAMTPPSSRPAVMFAPPPPLSGLSDLATGGSAMNRSGPEVRFAPPDPDRVLARAAYQPPAYNAIGMTQSESTFTPASTQTAETPIQEDRATRAGFVPPPPMVSPAVADLSAPFDPSVAPAVTPPPSMVEAPPVTPPPIKVSAPAAPPASQPPPAKRSWLSGIVQKGQAYVDALAGSGGGIGWSWTPTVQGTSPVSGTPYTAGPGARGGWTTQWTTSDGRTITTRENPNTGMMETMYG